MTTPTGLSFNFSKDVDSNVNLTLQVQKVVASEAVVLGNLADAQANASATGPNSLSETDTVTNVAPAQMHEPTWTSSEIPNFTTTAFSESVSAANGAVIMMA